jgi:hypothetical protein
VPLLFLLVVEGLSRLINQEKYGGGFQGIHIGGRLYISHLLFVDDILLFVNGSCRDIIKMKSILNIFVEGTGMIFNALKSSISHLNISRDQQEWISSQFDFPVVDIEVGLKYLGFILKPNSYSIRDWMWLVEKVEKKLNLWCNRWLSRGGHHTLIKYVLQAIPVFWLSIAYVPKGVLNLINKLCNNFLWKNNESGSTFNWIRWDKLSLPKALGGWGYKDLHSFTQALAAKGSWRIIIDEGLWTKFVTQKYIHPLYVVEWIRKWNKEAKNISHMWHALLSTFYVIGEWLAWNIGSGHKFCIGQDPWIGCDGLHILPPHMIAHLHDRGIYFLAHIHDPVASTANNQVWYQADMLGFHGEDLGLWLSYITSLRRSHICISHKPTPLYGPIMKRVVLIHLAWAIQSLERRKITQIPLTGMISYGNSIAR